MRRSQSALDTLKQFLCLYFEKRDLDGVCALFSDDICWVGTEDGESFRGKAAVRAYLSQKIAADSASYSLQITESWEHPLTDYVVQVFLSACVLGTGPGLSYRITASVQTGRKNPLILTVHSSASPITPHREISSSYNFVKNQEQQLFQNFWETAVGVGVLGAYREKGFPFYTANPKMIRLLGYTCKEEFISDVDGLLQNIVHPDDRITIKQTVLSQLAKYGEYHMNCRLRKKDRSYICVTNIGKEIYTPDNKAVLLTMSFDSTDQQAAEASLKEQAEKEKLLNVLFDSTSSGIFRSNLFCPFEIRHANDTFYALHGYTRQQFQAEMKNREKDLVFPEDLPKMQCEFLDYLQDSSKNLEMEYRIVKRNGTIAWLHSSSTVQVEDGSALMVGIVRDITESKLAQEALMAQSYELENIYNTIPGGIYRCRHNLDGDIVYANDGFFEFLGYSRKEFALLFHNKIAPIIYNADKPLLLSIIESHLPDSSRMDTTHRVVCKGGAVKWIAARATLLHEDDGDYFYCIFVDISEQKENERLLQENAQRYQTSMEDAGLALWQYDVAGRRIIQSEVSQKIHGQGEVVENVPQIFFDRNLVCPESEQECRKMYQRIAAGEKRVYGDLWLFHPDSDRRWCERVTYSVLTDEKGEAVWAYATGQDVTAQKLAEIKYREELLYRERIADTLLASCRMNLTRNLVEEVFITGEPVRGEPYISSAIFSERLLCFLYASEITPQQSQNLSPSHLLNLYQKGIFSWCEEYLAQTAPGNFIWVRSRVNLVKRPGTGDVVSFCYTQNITEQKTLQAVVDFIIAHDYEYVRRIDMHSNSCVLLSDTKNSSLPEHRSFDYDLEAMAFVRRLCPPECVEQNIKAIRLSTVVAELAQKSAYTCEFDLMEPNGELRRKQFRFSYMDRKAGFIFMTRTDIDDIVKKEAQKQQLLEQAMQSARQANDSKSDFLARMSHDMRTPMNAILGMATLGVNEASDAQARYYFENINLSASFLLGLINDVLDMTKIESGAIELCPEPYHISEFSSYTDTIVRPLCESKQIAFHFTAPESDVEWIVVDKLRFNQIFFNLLSNAVKFTPQGGEVSLIIQHLERKGNLLHKRFIVKDTGIGMSTDFQTHMFEPFSQEHSDLTSHTEGSGLGLAIAKKMVDLMGGSISVLSEPGKGTTFTVDLQVKTKEDTDFCLSSACDSFSALAEGNYALLNGKNVLLCEDHPLNAQLSTRLLEKKGVRVFHAQNGRLGVEAFTASQPFHFDAVLMDIRMPLMDGLQACREIRALPRPDAATVPIIAMTANAYMEDVEKSKEAGMNDHLAKPVQPKTLYDALLHWTRR